MGGDAEIGDSEMAKPFPVLGILIARESHSEGVVLWDVCPGGPAHRAGLLKGDCILHLDGHEVHDRGALLSLLKQGAYGRVVKIGLTRDGKEREVEATLDRFIDG